MSGSARSSLPARVLKAAGVGVVIVLALVVILTALRTELPRSPGVMSDALGPDGGEQVSVYLDRAAASLAEGGVGDDLDHSDDNDNKNDDDNATAPPGSDSDRWALVSASGAWSVSEADRVSRGLPRVSGLIIQVPVDGVAMPATEFTLAEPIAGEDSREPVFGRGLDLAAARMAAATVPAASEPGASAADTSAPDASAAATSASGESAGGDRPAATVALTASRIRAGEPAIIGLVVRGNDEQLRDAAMQPGVRAVEALPADAVRGRFSVRPLLPQQIETATPLPDGGALPAR